MTEDRGRLLFDESQHPLFNRRAIVIASDMAIVSAGSGGVFAISIWSLFTSGDLRVALITILFAMIFTFFAYGAWGYWRLKTCPVRIFETGIEFPPKNERELRSGGRFVPFGNVNKIYLSQYTAFELRSGEMEYIYNEELYGFEDLISVLKERVEIDRHAGWTPEIGVTWKKPDRFVVRELELEMSWGDVKKCVAFDSLRGLSMGTSPDILHYRDGRRLAVDLDEDMSHRFTRAWSDYEERFWRDPETEEERWEELEDHRDWREEK